MPRGPAVDVELQRSSKDLIPLPRLPDRSEQPVMPMNAETIDAGFIEMVQGWRAAYPFGTSRSSRGGCGSIAVVAKFKDAGAGALGSQMALPPPNRMQLKWVPSTSVERDHEQVDERFCLDYPFLGQQLMTATRSVATW
ncbi:hypothetical protein RGR602_CH03178 [Rhizobium gallicum bv. gallicum R602sp]|uniref:Uncharacterized protein n=1 Tax=Rhizobium gallicum bv. gallicum R602sp TaxID=1041138 RepID=A0A0B4X310_9HYPH|nr:hypothetical protein RGR602_CH03178 [Rhizobium gallicum bv. gallicum R602sp]